MPAFKLVIISRKLRWIAGSVSIGIGAATALVVLYRLTQSPLALRMLLLVDRLGFWLASWLTHVVFPGDRIRYGMLSDTVLFDMLLVLAMGVQTGCLGACIAFFFAKADQRQG